MTAAVPTSQLGNPNPLALTPYQVPVGFAWGALGSRQFPKSLVKQFGQATVLHLLMHLVAQIP